MKKHCDALYCPQPLYIKAVHHSGEPARIVRDKKGHPVLGLNNQLQLTPSTAKTEHVYSNFCYWHHKLNIQEKAERKSWTKSTHKVTEVLQGIAQLTRRGKYAV